MQGEFLTCCPVSQAPDCFILLPVQQDISVMQAEHAGQNKEVSGMMRLRTGWKRVAKEISK